MLELRGNVAICFVIHLKRGSRYTCRNRQVLSVSSHQLNIEHLSLPSKGGDSERNLVWKELNVFFIQSGENKAIHRQMAHICTSIKKRVLCLRPFLPAKQCCSQAHPLTKFLSRVLSRQLSLFPSKC